MTRDWPAIVSPGPFQLSPAILGTIGRDPSLAAQMATLMVAPRMAVRWLGALVRQTNNEATSQRKPGRTFSPSEDIADEETDAGVVLAININSLRLGNDDPDQSHTRGEIVIHLGLDPSETSHSVTSLRPPDREPLDHDL